jgi:hypothetical protein
MIPRSTALGSLVVLTSLAAACGGTPTAPTAASFRAESAAGAGGGTATTEAKAPAAPTSCAVPAGQITMHGRVVFVGSIAGPTGNLPQNFEFVSDAGGAFYVVTNYYDGSAPLTAVLNLNCKTSPAQFVSLGLSVTVTGTLAAGPGRPTLNASVVQVPTNRDKF